MVTPAAAAAHKDIGAIERKARLRLWIRLLRASRFIRPEEVAAAVLWLCGDAARSITGQTISISGGETW